MGTYSAIQPFWGKQSCETTGKRGPQEIGAKKVKTSFTEHIDWAV